MTELQRIEKTIEGIKCAFELIINTKKDDIEIHTQLFIDSVSQLEKLLPQITKYKFQLKRPEDERPFGSNTSKRIELLIEKFEILYSVYQDELEALFPNTAQIHSKNDRNITNKSSSEDEYEAELQKMIEKCKVQTIIELENLNNKTDTSIQIGKNLDNIVINKIENDILNEIRQSDTTDKAKLLNTGLEYLKNNEISNAKNHIIELCDQIYRNPEALQLRVLRIGNELLQERILRHKGGITCLLAFGFELKYGNQIIDVLENLMDPKLVKNEPYLYLREPPVEEFDEWEQWRSNIKLMLEVLKSSGF